MNRLLGMAHQYFHTIVVYKIMC